MSTVLNVGVLHCQVTAQLLSGTGDPGCVVEPVRSESAVGMSHRPPVGDRNTLLREHIKKTPAWAGSRVAFDLRPPPTWPESNPCVSLNDVVQSQRAQPQRGNTRL